MFHRGFPDKKVRVCKHCAPYVEVKLAVGGDEDSGHPLGPGRAASVEKSYLNNDTFVKSFQSRRRVLAPEDSVHAHHLLNRVLEKHAAMFLTGNDLLIKPKQDEAADEANEGDEDNSPKTLQAEHVPEVDVNRIRQGGGVALSHSKDPAPIFPAANTVHDCLSLLLDPSILAMSVLPSFQRLKDGLTSAHHIAVNVEPQPLPSITQPIFCY